eukprot:scaffold927_cov230-Pinguiococcus_pyrenoidosus.AAC.9
MTARGARGHMVDAMKSCTEVVQGSRARKSAADEKLRSFGSSQTRHMRQLSLRKRSTGPHGGCNEVVHGSRARKSCKEVRSG